MDEKSTIKDLERQASNTKLLMDRLTRAAYGMTFDELSGIWGGVTMTPNEAIRRITQRAMERHRLSQRGLAMRSDAAKALLQRSWTSRRFVSLRSSGFI